MANISSMQDFDIPNDGEIPICEINGRVHFMNFEYANVNAFTNSVENHPKIHITADQLHPVSSGDEGKALFLPVDISFLKRITQVYYEQGFIEALHTAKAHNQLLVSKAASAVLDIYKYIQKVRLVLNPNLKYSGPILINQLAQTRSWVNATIRCVSWHPHLTKVAVATNDDSVRIFSCDSSYTPLLRCKEQKNVTCVAWRPMSNTEIAVGHENGVIIWNVDPNSLVARPSIVNAIILQKIKHRPILSIAWSPKGDLLVTAAGCDNTILVWDPELNRTSSLKRPGGFGNTLVKWCPNGEKLLTCSNSLVFRVWDCRTWECERWTVPSGRVQSACWACHGTTLLFSTNLEPVIYGVVAKSEVVFAGDDAETSSSMQAVPLFDVSKTDLEGVLVGGLAQSMEADSGGRHMAVVFQDTNCVAVFSTVQCRQGGVQVIPSSLVIGFPEEKPSTVSFQQNFSGGACLSVAWSSGRMQYYPIIYTDLTNSVENESIAASGSNWNSFRTSLLG